MNRYSLFPLKYPTLFEFFDKQSRLFWVASEIDMSQDSYDFYNKLNENERHFVSHILAFFNSSDGIVNENLAVRFYNDTDIPEARAFYTAQLFNESIHSHTYSLLIDSIIKDRSERDKLFDAINTIPCVKKKADFCFKYIQSHKSFAHRLFAFACVELVQFSGSFCSIYWLKKRNLLPGLSKANDFISRDEGLHGMFASELYKTLKLSLPREDALQILQEAVDTEREFITASLPVSLIGMNDKLMTQYIEYTADRLLQYFNFDKHYKVENPFDFMKMIDLENKVNFFEARVSEYSKTNDRKLSFDEDF